VGSEDGSVQGFKQRLVTEDQIQKVVSGLFPAQRKLDEDGVPFEKVSGKAEKARQLILDQIEKQEERARIAHADAGKQGPGGVTALDVFLGVSEYVAKDRTTKNEGNSWVAATFGTGADMRQKAFDLVSGL